VSAVLVLCSATPRFSSAQPEVPAESAPPASEAVGEADVGAAVEETSVEIEEARRRYAQGAEFFRRNRYAEAVAEFSEAYRLWENPAILYALGQAYEGLTQVRQAIDNYRRYLDTMPAEDERRAAVETRIDQLERLLATVRVTANVPGTLYVNDEREGQVPGEFRLPTGRHRLELRADGYETARQAIVVAAGTDREIVFELREIESTTQILQVSERRRIPRPAFYTMLGVTGAAAVTWGSLATVTLVRRNRYNANPISDPSDERAARDWARRADIMLGITGGLGAATLVIGLLTEWGDEPSESERDDGLPELGVSVLPQGAALEMTFRR
jgi:hypothetical protein